ncbi:MAG: flagellar basal body L-ring protein FlgH [Burkholderiaceae bacterium]
MKRIFSIGLTTALALTLAACDTFNPKVDFPIALTARPEPAALPLAAPSGGIYQVATYRPMFEDRRARMVGDTITIVINEKVSASQNNGTSASRSDSASIGVPLIQSLFGPGNDLNAINGTASSSKKFDGKGQSTANNLMSGTLTATVLEVLPNGNLRVAGEKQLGTNRELEYVRLYGVVNPATILVGNVVNSTQIADARIEYRGKGAVDSALVMGWLSRAFLSFLPF